MSTGRKLVSDVRGSHKLLSSDNLITDRVILSEIRNASNLLVKRETNLRRLWATDTVFTTIPCLELTEVPISECCDFVDECNIARSKFKLPRMSEGNYQYVIQGVWTINAMGGKGKKLIPVTVNRYTNILKLELVKKDTYWWLVNNYLYVSDPSIIAVRIAALFEEDIPNEIMFPSCDCGTNYSKEELCKNPLDKEFPLPGYLEKQVLELVSQKLLSTYFQIRREPYVIDDQSPEKPK